MRLGSRKMYHGERGTEEAGGRLVRADMMCEAGVKGGTNGPDKAPADVKASCISR